MLSNCDCGAILDYKLESSTIVKCTCGRKWKLVWERIHHQPPPKPGKEKVLDVLIQNLRDRAEEGKVKYGTYLQTYNGRDPRGDKYEELLDLLMYFTQELMEAR